MNDIRIESGRFVLTVGSDAVVKSLTLKSTGEELLAQDHDISLFSVTQLRPFNNEVKLAHPNKHTVFQANSLRREGDMLFVRFETVPVKARIRITEAEGYAAFTLDGFDVEEEDYGGLKMDLPPVAELRLVQLPVKHRRNFGEWLNVVWDDSAAVAVIADSLYTRIECEKRKELRLLTADAVRSVRLIGTGAVLLADTPDKLLDDIDMMEQAYSLPRGVQNRRGEMINRSVYWTGDLCPANLEEHIMRAKQGGFTLMLIYYTSFFKEIFYDLCGDYDFNDNYPNGYEDVKYVLKRLNENGIQAGFHFLQTHIGLKSRYVTPVPDPRLGLTRHFTLSAALDKNAKELTVCEDTLGTVMHEACRCLRFGNELIRYEGYTAEPPYTFFGLERGALGTNICEHPVGEIGGILDISEYGGISCYVNEDNGLQDEIADKLAKIYNLGFRFCYMDGSEGTNPPYEYNVPKSQFRVYRKFEKAPMFTEGAAKAHFSWHFQAGGNAFDIFPPKIFKAMIAKHPAAEAPCMRNDFTRLDFGWWGFWTPTDDDTGIQADMYEYGTSVAAAWDCPATIQTNLERFRRHPRIDDIMEVMRRWEDVRKQNLLTDEMRESLRDTDKEHTLILNENGEYELYEWKQLKTKDRIRAFTFERKGKTYICCWHECGEGELKLGCTGLTVEKEIGKPINTEEKDGVTVIPVDNKVYISSENGKKLLDSWQ